MIAEARRISIGLSLVVLLSLVFGVIPVSGGAGMIGALVQPDNVDFSADPTSGYAPLEVEFTDETTFPPSQGSVGVSTGFLKQLFSGMLPSCEWVVMWDFGDGGTAETGKGDGTTHTYTSPGEYTVSMTYEPACHEVGVVSFVPVLSRLARDSAFQTTNGSSSLTVEKRLYITVLARKEYEPPPAPAKMMAANLNVNPTEVVPGQEVVVSANVCNSGGESGVKTATLFVNGYAEQSQTVGVSPGACKEVVFRVYKGPPGTYLVNVEGMQGQFTVVVPRIVQRNVPSQQDTGLGTAGIIAIVVVGIVLIIAVMVILKKE